MSPSPIAETSFIWKPDPERVADANVTRLMSRLDFDSASDLRAFALAEPAIFWDAVVDDLDLEFDVPYTRTFDASNGREWVEWFVDGKLNFARLCLDRWSQRWPERLALTWESERGERRQLTWARLRAMTDGVARALRDRGVESGHTVGLYLPLIPEAVAAYYGCAKVGAIAVPIFSGFGPEAVATRLTDCEARILVTADGFPRAGKEVDMKAVADAACDLTPTVEHVLVHRRLDKDVAWNDRRDVGWEEIVDEEGDPFEPLSLDASHPLQLMYTSGTTGRPKGALHSHGGFLAIAARDAAYGLDLRDTDTMCWVTDLGWIMGPWTITAAGTTGVHICLCEGSPMTPATRLWETAERNSVTVLGVGPSLVRGMMSVDAKAEIRDRYDLGALRVIGTGGEPMPPDAYRWLFDRVGGGRCPIVNLSGGTEVGGCFLIPLPVEGLKPSSLGGPALGMDMAVFDDDGAELGPNAVGELVCRSIWPGMTQGLWHDNERFLDTYWRRFPGVWTHGDWASFDEDGQWFLHGRSDDTLNIAGQRIGPAEIESVLIAQPGVIEAAAVAMPHPIKGEAIWSFVVLEEDALIASDELSDAVSTHLGKPFRPERLIFCPPLPRTRSGKIVRRAIRAAAMGESPGDVSTLENPDALRSIQELSQ
jgi:acetyl-CoA synthetase